MTGEIYLYPNSQTGDRSTKQHETKAKYFLVLLVFRVVSCDLVDRPFIYRHEEKPKRIRLGDHRAVSWSLLRTPL
jgi:hypothetical protein